MSTDEPDRCPDHPDLEPIRFEVGQTRSHQNNYPMRLITVPGCPVCGPQV